LRALKGDKKKILDEIAQETKVQIDVAEAGIYIKADALGSLEALAFEAARAQIPIRKYEVGDISRRDLVEASAYTDPLHKAILAFNIAILPDAKDIMSSYPAKVFLNNVVYGLIDDYKAWVAEEKRKLELTKRGLVAFPGKVKILPNCVFRVSKPAIVGVRVLGGRIRTGQTLLDKQGNDIGKVRSIRSGEDAQKEALAGQEIAIAIEGPTIGRQINVDDIMWVDILESEVQGLSDHDLNTDERMVLDELIEIKRKKDKFWGM
jgi:translation initiation factor 5B